ncbi:hypothetical protein [Rhodococcus phenolicus]|uniref:hypothetical protein n=1 Tax=Rhodococcus phenolicus TaxID=263849 RepID=UPI000832FA63|nr:hypothetical protein [Rhodococcus phenolicus]
MEDRALVKSGAGATAVASVTGCNGVLDVFLLALDIDASTVPRPPIPPIDTIEPFLPARLGAGRDTDHGVRPAALLAYRHLVDRTRPEVSFGVATGSLRAGPTPARSFVGAPATCVSLWEIPGHGLVLALETLTDAVSPLIGRRVDPLQDRDGQGFRPAADGFLAPFELTSSASLEDLFPGINRMMPAPTTYRPLHEIVAHRHRGVGDRAVVEALMVEVVSSGGDRVRDLVDGTATGPLARAAARVWGVLWGWDRVHLVDVPAQPGAAIAVREDSGAVLLDLEATSEDSDYATCGAGEMIFGLLPWVAMRASCSRDFWQVLAHLRNHEDLDGDRLRAALDDVAAMQARKMERVLLRKESIHDDRFHSWTQPTQLRSVLVRRVSDEIADLDGELAEAAEVIEHAVRRSVELRGQRHSRLARAWSVAASAIAVVALFAALAAVPAASEPTLFPHWLHAFSVTVALTVVAVAVAVLWRRR